MAVSDHKPTCIHCHGRHLNESGWPCPECGGSGHAPLISSVQEFERIIRDRTVILLCMGDPVPHSALERMPYSYLETLIQRNHLRYQRPLQEGVR